MKRALWFGLSFVALTVPLTWLWVSGGRELFAEWLFAPLAGAIYDALGLEVRPVWRERYIHYLPFIALVLLTPRLGAKRKAKGLAGGVAAIFLCDVVINGITQHGQRHPTDLPMPLMVLSDALPFIVWAVIARDFVRELARGVMQAPSAEPPEDAPGPSSPRD